VDQVLADEKVTSLNNAGDILWPLGDNLGTVRDLATYDSQTDTTTVANHITYDAYGKVTAETNSAIDHLFAYTGRQFDEATALQNNLNRWYDPAVGGWLNQDPIGFEAGDANLCRYVANAPTIEIDPTGLMQQLMTYPGAVITTNPSLAAGGVSSAASPPGSSGPSGLTSGAEDDEWAQYAATCRDLERAKVQIWFLARCGNITEGQYQTLAQKYLMPIGFFNESRHDVACRIRQKRTEWGVADTAEKGANRRIKECANEILKLQSNTMYISGTWARIKYLEQQIVECALTAAKMAALKPQLENEILVLRDELQNLTNQLNQAWNDFWQKLLTYSA
jgi:RHS repeat-associated protein